MYVCGPTVYNYAHIGNARPAVVFDLLYRLLCYFYPQVVYARNITDIDDKIIKKSQEEGLDFTKVAQHYYNIYQEDIQALNVLSPSIEPWATQHINDMINLIEKLVQTGYAYEAEGHVLFHVPAYADYGRLSRQSREDMIAGARVEVVPYKKDPTDFVLWKPSNEEQPGWTSPWGRGRPGWHIECSAMVYVHFGANVDIHGGGQDLIFPHHDNEIAQSSCAAVCTENKTLARFWLHNGFVRINQEKMSKSLGNVFLLRDILKKAPGELVRLALLTTHYRGPLDWNEQALEQARNSLNRFYECLAESPLASELQTEAIKMDKDYQIPQEFIEALSDDLNTSSALAVMHNLTSKANSAKSQTERKKYSLGLLACGKLMGIIEQRPQDWFKNNLPTGLSISEIEAFIQEREEARRNGNFVRADAIRDLLAAKGIALQDGLPKGEKKSNARQTQWKVIH